MKNTNNPTINCMSHPIFILRSMYRAFAGKTYVERSPLKTIGSYKLSTGITKQHTHYEYLLGAYLKQDKKYFIKTCLGSTKSMQYQLLQREFLIADILQKKLQRTSRYIRVPAAIEWIENDAGTSAVFEYVDGETLVNRSVGTQIEEYKRVFSDLTEVSDLLTNHERRIIGSRTSIFYFLSIVFFTMRHIFTKPKDFTIIIPVALRSIRNLFKINKQKMVLAHRDLSVENMMHFADKIYLLDTGIMTLTYEGFDSVDMYLLSTNDKLFNILKPTLNSTNSLFFYNYIILHRNIRPDIRYSLSLSN